MLSFAISFLFCFQYNATMTVFIGGINSMYQIAIFDWVTRTYRRLSTRLRDGRWLSSCSLLRDKHGSLLVAVFGGQYSSDLEAWNPEDGTVTSLADLQINNESLRSTQLIPINDNTELLMYGGYSRSDQYHDDVWKYSSATNSWAKVSKMSGTKSSLVVLPLEDDFCQQLNE